MTAIALILSSQLIDYELSLDFGEQIPVLLPYQGEPLFITQLKMLPHRCTKVYISIPKDFELETSIMRKFLELGIETIRCEPDLKLGDATLFSLTRIHESIGAEIDELFLLYGDTMIMDFQSIEPDTLFVVKEPSHYRWGKLIDLEGNETIFAGGFTTTKFQMFRDCLEGSRDMIQSLQIFLNQNLARTIMAKSWLDFGHLGTYYRSRALEVQSRHFNSVKLVDNIVTKSSQDTEKISGEVNWYQSIPAEFVKFTPRLITSGPSQYQIDYVPFPTLYELEIFGRLSMKQWKHILSRLCEVFMTAKRLAPNLLVDNTIMQSRNLISHKTRARIYDIEPRLWIECFGEVASEVELFVKERVEQLIQYIEENQACEMFGVFHGDMCSTNLFSSHLSETIKLIDPRGISYDGQPLLYGDVTYDLAKIYQSLFLGYDAILAGRYSIELNYKGPKVVIETVIDYASLEKVFEECILKPLEVSLDYIRVKAILLLLSLIPLHSESTERQKAFLSYVYSVIIQEENNLK